jgi:hypothetical protein
VVDPDLSSRRAKLDSQWRDMAVWAGEARAFATRHHIDQLGISTFCNYLTLSDGQLKVQESPESSNLSRSASQSSIFALSAEK